MEINEAKELVIKAGKELAETGLIARTWGNISCRISSEAFAITASGRNYLTLTDDLVILIKISDLSYQGNVKPSTEKQIHRDIYQIKPEVGFIIHTHQEHASEISAMGIPSFEVEKESSLLGNRIYCAEYGLPGTKKLCKKTIEAILKSKGNAVILKHHGAVCFGRDYEEAFEAARTLEDACSAYLLKNVHAKKLYEFNMFKEKSVFEVNLEEGAIEKERENAIWNNSEHIIAFSEMEIDLLPYLDDFAQIVGVKAKVIQNNQAEISKALEKESTVIVKGRGALCIGRNADEAQAVSLLVSKNCKAYFASQMSGKGKPISLHERILMRQFYLKKYSKLSE